MAKETEAKLTLRIKEVGLSALEAVKTGLMAVGVAAVAAFGIIVGIATKSVAAYKEHEEAVNRLNQSLIQQGIFSVELAKNYQLMAQAIQKKTTFGDEEVMQAQTIMQGYLGQTKITEKLMMATADLAKAKGIDLSSAAALVGRTIGTETNALARQGIQIDASTTKTERLSQVTSELSGRFGGQAEAAASGLGVLTQLKDRIGEVFEAIGERLAPSVVLVATQMKQFFEMLAGNTSIMDRVSIWAAALSETVAKIAHAVRVVGIVFSTENSKIAAEVTTSSEKLKTDILAIEKTFEESMGASRERELENIRANNAAKRSIAEEEKILHDADFAVKSEEELIKMQMQEQVKTDIELSAQLTRLNNQIKNEQDITARVALERQKRNLVEQQMDEARKKQMWQFSSWKQALSSKEVSDTQSMLGQIESLSTAHNRTLFYIGKAAALANIAINTARGITLALATFPPPVNFIFAGAIGAAGAVQAAQVSGTNLAEGGLVRARAGGVLATIGEGGRDEAVIPLDDDRASGALGGTYNVIVYGGLMGDEHSARELAISLDKELLKLRRSNQSVAFDSGVV